MITRTNSPYPFYLPCRYRARIVEVLDASVRVVFVDYGNPDTVPKKDIRPLGSGEIRLQFDRALNFPF